MTPLQTTCADCGGDLGPSEAPRGTCGHCGRRSRDPNAPRVERHQIADLDGYPAEPVGPALDSIEAAYREEGFRDVVAIPKSGNDRTWQIAVFASNNPYQEGRP